MRNFPMIVVEVPHQRRASAWTAYCLADLVNAIPDVSSIQSVASVRENVADDPEGFAAEAEAIEGLRDDQFIACTNTNAGDGYESYDSEDDAALACIGHDLSGILTFENAEEVKQWLDVHSKPSSQQRCHQEIPICVELEKEAERLGWFTSPAEEESGGIDDPTATS